MLMGIIDGRCVATMCIMLVMIVAVHSGQAQGPTTGPIHIHTGTRHTMAMGHSTCHWHCHRSSRLHPNTCHIHLNMSISYTLLRTRLGRVKDSNKRRRKIDIGSCFFLDLLNCVTLATGDDVMKFVIDVT